MTGDNCVLEGYENMYEKAYPIRYPNLSSDDDDDEVSSTWCVHRATPIEPCGIF